MTALARQHCCSWEEQQHPGFPPERMGPAPKAGSSALAQGLVGCFPGIKPSLTQGGSVEQAIPVAGGGQGQQPLAARIHCHPPVQAPWGNLGEREAMA